MLHIELLAKLNPSPSRDPPPTNPRPRPRHRHLPPVRPGGHPPGAAGHGRGARLDQEGGEARGEGGEEDHLTPAQHQLWRLTTLLMDIGQQVSKPIQDGGDARACTCF